MQKFRTLYQTVCVWGGAANKKKHLWGTTTIPRCGEVW